MDPTARKYGSTSQELRILQSLDHDCVVNLEEAYDPYFPASPREGLDTFNERRQIVLVLPAYDMDLKYLMRLRDSCPEDFLGRFGVVAAAAAPS